MSTSGTERRGPHPVAVAWILPSPGPARPVRFCDVRLLCPDKWLFQEGLGRHMDQPPPPTESANQPPPQRLPNDPLPAPPTPSPPGEASFRGATPSPGQHLGPGVGRIAYANQQIGLRSVSQFFSKTGNLRSANQRETASLAKLLKLTFFLDPTPTPYGCTPTIGLVHNNSLFWGGRHSMRSAIFLFLVIFDIF